MIIMDYYLKRGTDMAIPKEFPKRPSKEVQDIISKRVGVPYDKLVLLSPDERRKIVKVARKKNRQLQRGQINNVSMSP
jgi:hypothetical protein